MRSHVLVFTFALSFAAPVLVGCDDDSTGDEGQGGGGTSNKEGGGSSSNTSESKFTCKLNGTCYKCPTGDAVTKCALDGASAAGCTSAAESYCD